jgi:hypothetical protein
MQRSGFRSCETEPLGTIQARDAEIYPRSQGVTTKRTRAATGTSAVSPLLNLCTRLSRKSVLAPILAPSPAVTTAHAVARQVAASCVAF